MQRLGEGAETGRMTNRRTYVDSSILIAAFRGAPEVSAAAMGILGDDTRSLVVSEFVELEVLPKSTYNHRNEEPQFMQEAINAAADNVSWSSNLTTQAMELAKRHGLSAVDAIHANAALIAAVDELATGERPTKSLCRVTEVKVVSIRDGGAADAHRER